MGNEIGPKLAQLRELGQRKREERAAPPPQVEALRRKVADIKPKPKKPKKGIRK
jgi:hypothetical protein